jgi:hypothetical protein
MSLSLKLIANKPTIAPDTVLAQVVIPAGFSYTTAQGGMPINLAASAIADPSLIGGAAGPNFNLPKGVRVTVQGSDGYYAEWVAGTTLANGALRLWQPGGAEVGTGALGAPWTNSTCQILLSIDIDPLDHE